MFKYLFSLFIIGTISSAMFFLWKAITQVDFAYIRFRNGILTLQRKSWFSTKELEFRPNGEFDNLTPAQLASMADKLDWYEFPNGELIKAKTPKHEGIARALRFAYNTKLLEAEVETE